MAAEKMRKAFLNRILIPLAILAFFLVSIYGDILYMIPERKASQFRRWMLNHNRKIDELDDQIDDLVDDADQSDDRLFEHGSRPLRSKTILPDPSQEEPPEGDNSVAVDKAANAESRNIPKGLFYTSKMKNSKAVLDGDHNRAAELAVSSKTDKASDSDIANLAVKLVESTQQKAVDPEPGPELNPVGDNHHSSDSKPSHELTSADEVPTVVLEQPVVDAGLNATYKRLYKACPAGCTDSGTCNEEEGRCDCPAWASGPSCTERSMPRCWLTNHYWTRCANTPTTCDCFLDCEALWGLSHPYTCIDAGPELMGNLTAIYANKQVNIDTDMRGNVRSKEDTSPSEAWTPQDLSLCPGNCSYNGWCNKETNMCECAADKCGDMCEHTCQRGDFAFLCYNSCSGRGECLRGFCHCKSGAWGIDCSLSRAPDGGPPEVWISPSQKLFQSNYKADGSPSAKRPRIYVYELPPNYNQWLHVHGIHMERHEPMIFLERILHSEHRTTNPEEADFFFPPIYPRWHTRSAEIISATVDYIKKLGPYFERNNGADHLWFATADRGLCELGYLGKNHPEIKESIVLTMWGHRGNFEWDPQPYEPCFDDGKDICIPPNIFDRFILNHSPFPKIMTGALKMEDVLEREKQFFFYFSGSAGLTDGLNGKDLDWYSFGVRQSIYKLFSNRSDFNLVDVGYGPDWVAEMSQAKFCLAPSGYGWGIRTTQAVVLGCIPVIIQPNVTQPFENDGIIDWNKAAIVLDLPDIPRLPEILHAVTDAEVGEKMRAMNEIWTRVTWNTASETALEHMSDKELSNSIRDSVFQKDAFATTIEILGKRLERRQRMTTAPQSQSAS